MLRDEPAAAEVTERRVVFAGHIADTVSETFTIPEADGLTREFVEHPGAVVVLALDAEERVLAIRQYRHPVRSRLWELPAGILDHPGEDPLDAAARELAEETDYAADTWHLLLDFYASPGSLSESLRVYLARDLREIPASPREGEEAGIERAWIPLDELVDAVLDSRVGNGALVAAVLAAARHREHGFRELRPATAPWPSRRQPARED